MMMTQQVPAMCYVPWQRWDELYEPSRAIMRELCFLYLINHLQEAGHELL
ncbi:MAG: spore coat associated protein CotJA [Lachnospira eligens]